MPGPLCLPGMGDLACACLKRRAKYADTFRGWSFGRAWEFDRSVFDVRQAGRRITADLITRGERGRG